MNPLVIEFVNFVKSHKDINSKQILIDLCKERFAMTKDGRALYYTEFFAVVFCYSKNQSFSNVILSLSKLQKYDHIPCFVVLVRNGYDNLIYMINTTFLNKISHSSKELRTDNIKGSLLGSNVRKVIDEMGKTNSPEHFEDLFAYHQGFTWKENLERLVESTNNIKPTKSKIELTDEEKKNLYLAPVRAKQFVNSNDYMILLEDLRSRCDKAKEEILVASHIDNVNIRGRLIEVLITSDKEERLKLLHELRDIEERLPQYDTRNDLGDYTRHFGSTDAYIDVKTKVLYLDSNPKAYNIDKFLKCMGENKSVFMFFFVGIDETGIVNTVLVSVFHDELQNTTVLQHHWAGRGTRGVAQFNGKTINNLLMQKPFVNSIDEQASKKFLEDLIGR